MHTIERSMRAACGLTGRLIFLINLVTEMLWLLDVMARKTFDGKQHFCSLSFIKIQISSVQYLFQQYNANNQMILKCSLIDPEYGD